jgi:hypothetical protein
MRGERQMPKQQTYSLADLALARAMRRVAVKYDDQDLLQRAQKLEAAAQDEINQLKADQVFNLDCPV